MYFQCGEAETTYKMNLNGSNQLLGVERKCNIPIIINRR